jgi:hypothetical protein
LSRELRQNLVFVWASPVQILTDWYDQLGLFFGGAAREAHQSGTNLKQHQKNNTISSVLTMKSALQIKLVANATTLNFVRASMTNNKHK